MDKQQPSNLSFTHHPNPITNFMPLPMIPSPHEVVHNMNNLSTYAYNYQPNHSFKSPPLFSQRGVFNTHTQPNGFTNLMGPPSISCPEFFQPTSVNSQDPILFSQAGVSIMTTISDTHANAITNLMDPPLILPCPEYQDPFLFSHVGVSNLMDVPLIPCHKFLNLTSFISMNNAMNSDHVPYFNSLENSFLPNASPLLHEANTLPPPSFNNKFGISFDPIPDGNHQEDPFFQVFESDLPILEPFLNSHDNPTPTVQSENNITHSMTVSNGLNNSWNFIHDYPILNSMDMVPHNQLLQVEQVGFACDECGKRFDSSQALGGHKSYHSKMRRRFQEDQGGETSGFAKERRTKIRRTKENSDATSTS